MPAPTVSFVLSSIRMKLPVARLRRYSSTSSGADRRSRTRPISLSASPSGRYRIKHTTRTALAKVDDLRYRFDVNSMHRDENASGLALNEIGRVRLRLSAPLLVDEYRRNRATGSFVLIEESTNDTVGAGMILGADED